MKLDEYSLPAIRGYLLNLNEIRALVLSADGCDDTPGKARLRESFFCVLWDLQTAIGRLPFPLQQTLYWRYERSLTERQTADRLGLCQRALHKRLVRAEQLLEKFLGSGTQTPQKFALTYMRGEKE